MRSVALQLSGACACIALLAFLAREQHSRGAAASTAGGDAALLGPYDDGIDEFWSWPGLTRDGAEIESRALYNPHGYRLDPAQRRSVAAALSAEISRVQPLYIGVVDRGRKTAAERFDELGVPLPPGMKATDQPARVAPGEFPIVITTEKGTRIVRLPWGTDEALDRERLALRAEVEASIRHLRDVVARTVALQGGRAD